MYHIIAKTLRLIFILPGSRFMEISALNNVGICIKDSFKTVLEQNELCQKICGNMVGLVCDFGCMNNYPTTSPQSITQGMILLSNIQSKDQKLDAVIINDGDKITTITYPNCFKENTIKDEIEELRRFGLTKSELVIIEEVLKGYKNIEIAQKLFISEGTLKTHLNNIYKKLPERWQSLKKRKQSV